MSDQPPVAHDDGIDRADGARARRHLVEQRDHGFLIRKRDVHAGEAKAPDAVEQGTQFGRIGARNLDQLIMAADAQRLGRLLMHCRAADCAIGAQIGRVRNFCGSGIDR